MSPLSGDAPRGWALRSLLILVVATLALTPFVFPGAKPLGVAEKICVMALLAASYDLLLGYTGVVSFAHVMFFGIGSYGVALALYGLGPAWGALAFGAVAGLAFACALGLAIAMLSLRVQAIFFAMVTLAVAYAFNVLASQLSDITGGEDGGRSRSRGSAARLQARRNFRRRGQRADALLLSRVRGLHRCCSSMLLRVVNSPFGRVLQAIRENPFRAEALGYRIVFHRTLATCLSAAGAAAAGALNALWLRYVGPDTALSFSIQIDVLVIVVIGGMGSLYGAVIGAALFVIAENYLQALIGRLSTAAADAGLPLLPSLLHPDRWLLWLGVMFILAVYFAPTGIVGRLRAADE